MLVMFHLYADCIQMKHCIPNTQAQKHAFMLWPFFETAMGEYSAATIVPIIIMLHAFHINFIELFVV